MTGPSRLRYPAAEFLAGIENVHLHAVPTNDTWIRDFGPTFVRRRDDGQLVVSIGSLTLGVESIRPLMTMREPRAADLQNRRMSAQRLGTVLRRRRAGDRRCRHTADDQQRADESDAQPRWSREMVEGELQRQIGVTNIVWVDGGGLLGDDTDGHIDQLARFVAPGVIVAASVVG